MRTTLNERILKAAIKYYEVTHQDNIEDRSDREIGKEFNTILAVSALLANELEDKNLN